MNDTRDICTTLLRHSILQLQEIPRGAERTAQRMIFLYFIDVERAYGWLLDRHYRTTENMIRKRLMKEAQSWSIIQRIETREAQDAPEAQPQIRELLRDSEMEVWRDVEEDRAMLTLAASQAERDAFILSFLPG